MTEITVKSLKPNGFYQKTFFIKKDEWEKFGDLAMEAMTQAVEEVVLECKEKSNSDTTTSSSFVKHFFSSFGPFIWAYKKGQEDNQAAHYTTLTELALRNAGYSNLSSLVNRCTQKLPDDMDDFDDMGDFDDMDDFDEGEDGELF